MMLLRRPDVLSEHDALPNTPPPPNINTALRRQSMTPIISVPSEGEVKSCTNQSGHTKDIHHIQPSHRNSAPLKHTASNGTHPW